MCRCVSTPSVEVSMYCCTVRTHVGDEDQIYSFIVSDIHSLCIQLYDKFSACEVFEVKVEVQK